MKQVKTDYFTDAISYTKVKILEAVESDSLRNSVRNHGEIHLTTQVVGFKKIKFYTLENVGAGDLELPEQEMHTTSYWLTLPRELMDALPYSPSVRLGGVRGLAEAMRQMATLFLMCDVRDIQVTVEENQHLDPDVPSAGSIPQSGTGTGAGLFEPNLFIYDNYPGGIGLSVPLYEMHDRVLQETARLIRSCPCKEGCPSCVGPRGSVGDLSKQVALEILERIL